MSEIHNDILKLERNIEAAEAAIKQRALVDKLAENREFRTLIVEGFMKDECARWTHMSTDPGLSLQDRADCLTSAQAAGVLKRWLNVLVQMGNNAERDLVQSRQLLDELRAEAASE